MLKRESPLIIYITLKETTRKKQKNSEMCENRVQDVEKTQKFA